MVLHLHLLPLPNLFGCSSQSPDPHHTQQHQQEEKERAPTRTPINTHLGQPLMANSVLLRPRVHPPPAPPQVRPHHLPPHLLPHPHLHLRRLPRHKALVQNGSTFSDRPPALATGLILSSNQNNISAANYGPFWRLLRRNLMSEILHPSRVQSYSQDRKWALELMTEKLRRHADSSEPVYVVEFFHYFMFRLLLLMCFGQKLDENTVKKMETIHRRVLVSIMKFNFYPFLPKIGKLIFRKRWNDLVRMRRDQAKFFIPLIRARKDRKQGLEEDNKTSVFCYVDSLLGLEFPDEGGRKLTEGEMVSLCSEFLSAGADTTSTSLEWIIANLVKHQDMQQKLVEELVGVVGEEAEKVEEEDLNELLYLKAVIMEGLRRHPPGHFVLPHAVSEDVTFEGYVIPKGTMVNFTVADIGREEKVWEEPMAFRPERFLDCGENVDITGSREIKMMPFGAGRRMCPGLNLAMLHLEYFVANMMREFEWKTVEGEEVHLTEKQELWFLIFIFSFSLCLAVALNQLLTTTNNTNKKKRQLPPGPPTVPILGNLLWLTNTFSNIESVLSQLRLKYGPIISIRVGSHTLVFISDASSPTKPSSRTAPTFSDRPPALAAGLILSKNQNNISSANYGPLWRLLRRNLMSEILHPSRIKSYSQGRKWVLDHLIEKLKENANSGESVCIIKNFEHSMFRLLLLMCFGQKFDENTVKKIETAHKRMLVSIMKSNFYPFLPKIGKIIFRKRWNDLVRMRREQAEILVPFIRACEDRNQGHEDVNKTFVFCYVDSLLGLELLEEGGEN
ncbi:cytochrome P450 [Cinnamomum micranthum f. kanehirae]|uniref:Cytochrome P450 n=1 Tax=Cinnamomum micranthum f. kanehirae TaxID=337451 RepID=A0A3S3NHN4_9MAGN|nr:cytochrome P450 [Cinnamomum micranthum f. kanehirae]